MGSAGRVGGRQEERNGVVVSTREGNQRRWEETEEVGEKAQVRL